ncbi:MAG TPA: thiamine-phosphate kinase [Thermoanaerobaculia bacterium]|nr:thiamine-phosphate kinase [Thermoanaerobaculia bacterium]
MTPEDRFVEALAALLSDGPPLVLGPGDDAAIIAREAGLLAATTDMLVEGVDFLPGEDPERLGRRAVAVNLSDVAAMGARPEFFLLAIGFESRRGPDYPLAVARGAIARGADFGARLAGGDLSDAPQTVITVALWGRPAGEPLRRKGAAPGDLVYVSGHPGEAAGGLRLARRLEAFAEHGSLPTPHFPELPLEAERRLLAAYRDPTPRIGLGIALAEERLASAAIDVSDGVGLDAARLARASGIRVVFDRALLPVSTTLHELAATEDLDPLTLFFSGGDDYELLFTVPPDAVPRLEERAPRLDVPVTRIGRVEEGSGAVLADGRTRTDVSELGHDHFAEARR